jgi:hypothetical protein
VMIRPWNSQSQRAWQMNCDFTPLRRL